MEKSVLSLGDVLSDEREESEKGRKSSGVSFPFFLGV
jgi:hypothetical protein